MNITPSILIAALKTHPAYAPLSGMRVADILKYVMSIKEHIGGGITIDMYNGAEPDLAPWTIHITSAQWHKLQKK